MDRAELVERLRHLVSLNEPRNGGPYQGFAAESCVKAMLEAADALSTLSPPALKEARGVLSDYIDAAGGKDDSDLLMFERFDAAIAKATTAPLEVERWRTDIENAPIGKDVLAYGLYRWPDDAYMPRDRGKIEELFAVVSPTGDPERPFEDAEDGFRAGVFTHWRPLPPAPAHKGGEPV